MRINRFTALAVAALLCLSLPAVADIVERQVEPTYALTLRNGELCRNETGGALATGNLVYLSSFSVTHDRFLVTKADADVAGAAAVYVVPQAVSNNTNFYCESTWMVTAANTNGSTVGNPVYLSQTAGAWTLTAPTAANSIQQIVGRVRVVSASVGIIEINIPSLARVKIGSNELQAGAVSPASMGLTVRAGTNLAAGDLVYLSSYNAADGVFIASLADADVDGAQAQYVATGTIASGSTGTVYKYASVAMNVGGAAAGDPIYLTVTGTTTNTKSTSAPAGSDDVVQIVGRVQVTGAAGPVLIDLLDNVPEVATNQLMDDSVTNDKLANMTQGTIKVGGAANAPTDLDANDDGFILVGDGTNPVLTDFNDDGKIGIGDGTNYASQPITGDIALTNAGLTTIQAMAVEPTMEGLTCVNASGGDYAAGDFVYFSGHNATLPLCALADADVANGSAQYVVTAACTNTSTCVVARAFLVTGVDTSAVGAVGDPLYLTITGTTTNTWSAAAPTGVDDRVQIVARVTIDNAAGAFLADLRSLDLGKIARNEVQASSISTTEIANGTIANADIGDGVIQQAKLARRSVKFNFDEPSWVYLDALTGAPTGAAAEVIFLLYPQGSLQFYLEEQVGAPTLADVYTATRTTTANGMDFGLDDTDNDGMQLGPHQVAGNKGAFTGQTDAFYVKATFTIEDASGIDPACIGFHDAQAHADIDALAGLDAYGGVGEEVVALCIGSGAGVDPAVLHTYTKVNNAASVDTTLTTSTWADGATHTLQINVAANGAVTYTYDGVAPAEAVALTVSVDTFFPFIVHNSSADVNANFNVSLFEYGLQ